MQTVIEKANEQSIKKAADILKSGGLVVFPTETVYGLGTNAFDKNAVKKIYTAKGRPSDNPLIVHIAQYDFLDKIAQNISDKARELTKKFWPGALTVILNKKDYIPYETSGGLETIAVRYPSYPLAQKLIKSSGVPIAAPSANISGCPSSTLLKHVINDLNNKVDMIIYDENDDKADKTVKKDQKKMCGIESTIVDMTTNTPVLLRPGIITIEMLKETIGEIKIGSSLINDYEHPKAPGMKYKHYSPQADVYVVEGNLKDIQIKIKELIGDNKDKKVGVLACQQSKKLYEIYKNCFVSCVGDRDNILEVAENLYSALREFDLNKIDIVFAESFPNDNIGFAVMNRIYKAADYKIIKV